jgi:O-antigen ligase
MQGRSRASTWAYTTRIIADSPLSGVGFGEAQYMEVMSAYGYKNQYGVDPLDAPHNSYLQVAVYAGLPALAMFLLANAAVLVRAALLLVQRLESGLTATVFGLAVGLSGFLVCIYPDIQLFTQNIGSVYWIFLGLLLSLVGKVPEPAPSPSWSVSPPHLTNGSFGAHAHRLPTLGPQAHPALNSIHDSVQRRDSGAVRDGGTAHFRIRPRES